MCILLLLQFVHAAVDAAVVVAAVVAAVVGISMCILLFVKVTNVHLPTPYRMTCLMFLSLSGSHSHIWSLYVVGDPEHC